METVKAGMDHVTGTKSIFKSRTFWFNIVTILFAVLSADQELVDPEIAAVGSAVGNILLRKITTGRVHFTKAAQE